MQQVQHQWPGCTVGQKESQPVTSEVEVTFGEVVEAHRVVVADGDSGESQFSRPFRMYPRVRGEGQPVEKPVG